MFHDTFAAQCQCVCVQTSERGHLLAHGHAEEATRFYGRDGSGTMFLQALHLSQLQGTVALLHSCGSISDPTFLSLLWHCVCNMLPAGTSAAQHT